MKNKKVFVGLSGGVDSSVAAFLLKKEGYQVVGVFIKAWYPNFLHCNWRQEMRDAMRISVKLKIPFLICDLEKEYKKEVIDHMVNEYSAGRTPNPDVMCNKFIKFGYFFDFAEKHGADFIATGHYAQKKQDDNYDFLLESKDEEKDQTYFLWSIKQKNLRKILFPIGKYLKKEVRKIAEKAGLHTFKKKDSQGLCFLGPVDMKTFLKKFCKVERGDVLDLKEKKIGIHDGAVLYALGERHGFNITKPEFRKKPMYVISKNIEKNQIFVSENKIEKTPKKIYIKDLNLISNKKPSEVEIRTRYRECKIKAKVKYFKNQAVLSNFKLNGTPAPGQSLVFYSKEECLGGGIIDRIE